MKVAGTVGRIADIVVWRFSHLTTTLMTRLAAIRPAGRFRRPFFLASVHAGFALTGAMTVILGPILPSLQARWSLLDVQAGSLFTAQFAAGFLGASISLLNPRRSILSGFVAIAIGASLLSIASYHGAIGALAIMGFGLGLSITPMNLVVANASASRKGASLSLLNACWGLGAGLAPQLVTLSQRGSLRSLLLTLAACSLTVSAALFISGEDVSRQISLDRTQIRGDFELYLLFTVLLFCYVGSENCISGWIATYAGRVDALSRPVSDLLATLFWVSIMLARLASPLLLRPMKEIHLLLLATACALAGMALLSAGHSPFQLSIGVVLTGIGFAPVFPLSAALFFSRVHSTRHAGWVFATCGLGGAVLPWIVGLVSTAYGSLRAGFLVPAAATALILVLTLILRNPRRDLSLRASQTVE